MTIHQPQRAGCGTLILVLVGVAIFVSYCGSPNQRSSSSTDPLPPGPQNVPVATFPRGDGWEQIAAQGQFHFLLVDTKHSHDQDVYRRAAASVCGVESCSALFWEESGMVPKGLPMTEDQVRAESASWRYNAANGFRAWLWNCRIFPDTPREQCL